MRFIRVAVPVLVLGLLVWSLGACRRGPAEEPERFVAPFAVTPMETVREMLEMAGVSEDDVVYDLGSGDGRIPVTAAAEYGARAVGVELREDLIEQARERARRAGVEDRVRFLRRDLYETDISEATVVTLYLMPEANLRLRPILLEQLKPGARVVSHFFDMGEWRADRRISEGDRSPYLWIVPAEVAETTSGEAESPPLAYLWVVPADVAGTWIWNAVDTPLKRDYRLRVSQRFQELRPSLESGGQRREVGGINLEGDRLTLEFRETTEGGREEAVRIDGVVRGDRIEGRVAFGDGKTRQYPAVLRRIEPEADSLARIGLRRLGPSEARREIAFGVFR